MQEPTPVQKLLRYHKLWFPKPPFEGLKPFSSSLTLNCHLLITAQTFPCAAPSGNALQGYNQSHTALPINIFWVAAANPAHPRVLPAFSPSPSLIHSVPSDTNPAVKPIHSQGTGTQIPAASPLAINRERENRWKVPCPGMPATAGLLRVGFASTRTHWDHVPFLFLIKGYFLCHRR